MAQLAPLQLKMKTRVKWQGERIERRLDGQMVRGLGRFGFFVYRRTRRLMNKKFSPSRGHSKPGEPPKKITGILRDSTRYDLDRNAPAVTNLLPQQFERSAADVPAVLEYGLRENVRLGILFGEPGADDANVVPVADWERMGTAEQREQSRDAGGKFRKRRLINSKKLPPVQVSYEPRPALVPAFEEMQAKHVPDLWEDLL